MSTIAKKKVHFDDNTQVISFPCTSDRELTEDRIREMKSEDCLYHHNKFWLCDSIITESFGRVCRKCANTPRDDSEQKAYAEREKNRRKHSSKENFDKLKAQWKSIYDYIDDGEPVMMEEEEEEEHNMKHWKKDPNPPVFIVEF